MPRDFQTPEAPIYAPLHRSADRSEVPFVELSFDATSDASFWLTPHCILPGGNSDAPLRLADGEICSFGFTLQNNGILSASSVTLGLFVSQDSTVTVSDQLIASYDIGAVPFGGSTVTESAPLAFDLDAASLNLTAGTWHLALIADPEARLGDPDLSDNVSRVLEIEVVVPGNAQPSRQDGQNDEFLFGTALDDVLIGQGGADTLIGNGGNDLLAGDAAPDVLLQAHALVTELFELVFGRTPASSALDGFGNALAVGWLNDIYTEPSHASVRAEMLLSSLLTSPEARAQFDEMASVEVVRTVFARALDRQPSDDFATRVAELIDDGAMSVETFLGGLLSSPEYLAASGLNDMSVPPQDIGDMGELAWGLFQACFGRDPSADVFDLLTDALSNGADVLDLALSLVASGEFQSRFGALSFFDQQVQVLTHVFDIANLTPPEHIAFPAVYYPDGIGAFITEFTFGNQSMELGDSLRDAYATFLQGVGGGNRLDGGSGQNWLFGSRYSDTFVFDMATGGEQHVVDFNPGDLIEIANWVGNTSAFDALRQVGDDVVLSQGALELVLHETELSELTSDQFI